MKETNKDQGSGAKTEKKSDIQENNKNSQSSSMDHSGASELESKSESSATSTEATNKVGKSTLPQASNNAASVSNTKPILKQDHVESKDKSAINKSLGNLNAKECAATAKGMKSPENAEHSRVQHGVTPHSGNQNNKQTKVSEMNISSNPTNKPAETSADTGNRSFPKIENKPDGTKVEEKVKHVVCGENNLWVSGLDEKTRAAELKALFSRNNCKVISAKIVANKRHAYRQRFFGFVTMASSEDATKCVQLFNKTELHGKTISVEKTTQSSFPPRQPAARAPVAINNNEKKDIEVNKTAGVEKAKTTGDGGKNSLTEVSKKQDETQKLITGTSQIDEKQALHETAQKQDETKKLITPTQQNDGKQTAAKLANEEGKPETIKEMPEATKKQDETQKAVAPTSKADEKKTSVEDADPGTMTKQDEVQKLADSTSELDEKQTAVVEEGEKNCETNDEEIKEVCTTSEVKSENDEKMETDESEEKTTEKRDARYFKDRDFHPRDRFHDRRRSHRSRSRSRERMMRYSRREPFFRSRGPRSFGPRRPFRSAELFIEERFHHDRFRHEEERYLDYRRVDDRRAKEIARRNREESFEIEHERELLRIEKEKLELMRADVLRKEREQQRMEREKLEEERAELRKRSQLTEVDERRGLKRPIEGRGQKHYFPEERKRVAIPREPGSELPGGYMEFPPPRPAYPERRRDRFEGRPKADISSEFVEPTSRREGRPAAEVHTFPHGNLHHGSSEGKPRERALDRPHDHRSSNFNRLHHWENAPSDRPHKFGPPPPAAGPAPLPPPANRSQWGPARKDDNWGPIERQPSSSGVGPPPERWANMEYPRAQPPMHLHPPPNMGPPAPLHHPMYGPGPAGKELRGGNMPGNFPPVRFNAGRRF